jgi:vacuolar-type H+-ATPase subunit I/STV1
MKNVILAGTIAGLISGIVCSIIGYWWYSMRVFEFTPGSLMEVAVSLGVLTVIFGIIFSLIYARFYSLIPSEGVWKGLYFGLMIWLIKDIAAGSYATFVAKQPGIGIDFIVGGLYMWAIYGIALGYLYKKE